MAPPRLSAAEIRVAIFAVAILGLAIPVLSLTDSPIRYLTVIFPIAYLLIRRSIRPSRTVWRPTLPDSALAVLAVFAISSYLVSPDASTGLQLAAPMLLVFMYIPWSIDLSSFRAAVRALKAISYCYTLIAGVLAIINASLPGFSHERAFLIATAIAAAWVDRDRGWLMLLGVSFAFVFVRNPAGTYALAATAGAGVLVGRRLGSMRLVLMGLLTLTVSSLGLVLLRLGPVTSAAEQYFTAVGKVSNLPMRALALDAAKDQVLSKPILGNLFLGPTTVEIDFLGINWRVPPHNDFFEIAIGGGVVALILFLIWIGSSMSQVIRMADESTPNVAVVTATFMTAFLVVALVNPAIGKVETSPMFFLMSAVAVGHARFIIKRKAEPALSENRSSSRQSNIFASI